MSQTNDNNNRVHSKVFDWKAEVLKREGKEWAKPEPAYEFSNGRKFNEPTNGGPYQR